MTEARTPDSVLRDQPHVIVERDGVRYTLLGTAHVSQASVEAVRNAIASGCFDAVAVELDEARLAGMTDPEALARMDLIEVLRSGRTALFASHLALASYQRRLADQLGIEPGAELKCAVLDARARGLPVHLIDRDVGRTFRRAWGRLGLWTRAKLGAGLVGALIASEEVCADDIERLKQGDLLESTFGEFASGSPALYDTVIAERDHYMAARLRELGPGSREVLAVVGAGHLAGLARYLREEQAAPDAIRAALDEVPRRSRVPWLTLIFGAFLVVSLGWGFHRGGAELGAEVLMEWIVATALGGALGCLLAGGHPLSILVGALSSPITPLSPALASGTLSALVEAWVRKPTHADFLQLRTDLLQWRGWWRNRVARVLLNFFLTSTGTALGVWIGGARMLGTLVD